jgi:signal transduction histidine kinase
MVVTDSRATRRDLRVEQRLQSFHSVTLAGFSRGNRSMLTNRSGHPWPQSSPPTSSPCWSWNPAGLSDLSAIRRQLRITLAPRVVPPELAESEERLILCLDELVSNALRHGVPPVSAGVARAGVSWLLLVSDSAAEMAPRPDPTRDPAGGGMGLLMVADMSSDHGWRREEDQKHVWAVIPDEASPAGETTEAVR